MKPDKFRFWWWAALSVLVLITVFWPWFGPGFLSYGDWWHILPSRAVEYYQHLLIWDAARNFGSPLSDSAAHNAIHWCYGFLWQNFHVSPSISARLFWYIPFIIFSWVGAWAWGKQITGRRFGSFITALLYTLNTFSLNTVQGGQMTLAVSYALAPLSLYLMWRLVVERNRALAAWLGLTVALQAIYDVRMLAITLLAGIIATVYQLCLLPKRDRRIGNLVGLIIMASVLTILLSSYWLLPIMAGTAGTAGVPTDYTNTGWIGALSYATTANGLATNHVWWPWSEGVINPIQPLFFVTLLLALVALWQWRRKPVSLFLILLIVSGVFLLKGGNEPFPNTYAWLFTHVPGFIMFRDPAKFFTLLMLGAAPAASIGAVFLLDSSPKKYKIPVAVAILAVLWAPLYPFWAQARHGTFQPKSLPTEYQPFQTFYDSDQAFGRTLWVPNMQRYIPYTQQHPAVGLKDVAEGAWSALQKDGEQFESVLNHPYAEWLIKHAGIRWVGLPYDSENEIYQHFGTYSYFEALLASKPWLQPVDSGAPAIKLFAVPDSKSEVYVSKQIVALDRQLLNDYHPTLNNDDLLLLTDSQKGEHRHAASLERLRGISLNFENLTLSGQTAIWDWQTPIGFDGSVQLPAGLSQYRLAIDNQELATKKASDEMLNSNPLHIDAGSHQLKLDFGSPANLAYNGSFSNADWTACQDARGRLVYPDSYYHADENAGKTDVQMIYSSDESPGCMSLKLGVLQPGLYRVRVQSRIDAGAGLEAKLLYDNGHVEGDTAPTDEGWSELTVLANVKEAQPGELLLLANPYVQGDKIVSSKVAVASVEVQRLINTAPSYLGLVSSQVDAIDSLPGVSFDRTQPGSYSVSIAPADKPSYLVLNQAYNDGWRLTGVEALEHLDVNGSANAWLIPAHSEPLTITINYGNVAPFRWGILISLLSLLSVLVIAGNRRKKQIYRR